MKRKAIGTAKVAPKPKRAKGGAFKPKPVKKAQGRKVLDSGSDQVQRNEVQNVEELDVLAQVNEILNANYRFSASKPRKPDCFSRLPVEILEHIARFIPETHPDHDENLENFVKVCRATYYAVGRRQSGIWRHRISQRYDPIAHNVPATALQIIYKSRQSLLRRGTQVYLGVEDEEWKVVCLIKELVIESFGYNTSRNGDNKPTSKNIEFIRSLTHQTGILTNIHAVADEGWRAVEAVRVLQVVLMPWGFQSWGPVSLNYEYCQQAVYGHPREFPLFFDRSDEQRVHLDNMLYFASFFRYHVNLNTQGPLTYPFYKLSENQKPQPWNSRLHNELTKLEGNWKGFSACLHDVFRKGLKLRNCNLKKRRSAKQIFNDTFNYESTQDFSSLYLDFSKFPMAWPTVFEKHLHSMSPQGYFYYPFRGLGTDETCFYCAGILHALASQGDIPGFQRISLMAWERSTHEDPETELAAVAEFLDDVKGYHDIRSIERRVWAYEGVVLPGGKIIIGRWWNPRETPEAELDGGDLKDVPICREQRIHTGPFIFWKVE